MLLSISFDFFASSRFGAVEVRTDGDADADLGGELGDRGRIYPATAFESICNPPDFLRGFDFLSLVSVEDMVVLSGGSFGTRDLRGLTFSTAPGKGGSGLFIEARFLGRTSAG